MSTVVDEPYDLMWLAGCNWLDVAFLVPSQLSALMLATITVDRFILLYFPFAFRRMQKRRRAVAIISAEVVVAMLANFTSFGGMKRKFVDDDGKGYIDTCEGKTGWIDYYYNNIFHWVDAALYFYIPASVLMIVNVLIIIKVARSRSASGSAESQGDSSETTSDRMQTSQALQKYSGHLTRLSIILSCSYLLFVGPVMIWFQLMRTQSVDARTETLILDVMVVVSQLNHCTNFFFYVVAIPTLRKDLKSFFVVSTLCYSYMHVKS